MNWNMPYGAMRSSAARAVDHISPLSDIVVTTPQSPRGAASPMTVALREMTAIERTRLFVQGRQMDLLQSLEDPQRMSVVASSFLIAPFLTLYIVPCRRGCISIGSSPTRRQNIGAGALKTGLPTFFISLITIKERPSQSLHRTLQQRLQVHQHPNQPREEMK